MKRGTEKKSQLKYPVVLTRGLLALTCSVFVLYPGLQGYAAIAQAKAGMFYILFGGYLALLLLLTAEMLLTRQLSLSSPTAWRQGTSPIELAVLAYWAVSAVSAFASELFPYTILGMTRNEGLLTITLYCMSFLVVSRFAQIKEKLALLFAGVMIVFSVICLIQLGGGNPLSLYPEGTNYFGSGVDYAGEYLGTIGNADVTAALLSMAFPATALLAFYKKGRARLLYAASAALCLAVLALAKVRAGQLAVLLTTALVLPMIFPQKKRRRIYLTEGGLAVLLLLLLYCVNFRSGTLYELHCILHGEVRDEFGTGRVYIWRQVLSLVPQHLLLGTGPDTMAAASIVWGGSYNEALGGTLNIMVDTAHNEYLNVLYHQGIFGFVSFLAIVVIFLRQLFRSDHSVQTMVCGAAVLGYLIQAFFSFSSCAVTSILWLVLALFENSVKKETER